MNWLSDNYKWLFDGIVGSALIAIVGYFLHRFLRSNKASPNQFINNSASLSASPTIDNRASLNASPHIEQNVFVGDTTRSRENQDETDKEFASLSPLAAREVLLHQESPIWREASTGLERAHRAVVLPFKNVPKQPGQQTPRANGVSASLVFRNADGTEEMHISHGVWLDRVEYGATFNAGVVHELLVALKAAIPFVTLENPNAYNPFARGHFRSGMAVRSPEMRVVHSEGTVEIVLVDSHNVTMFHGTFEYNLSAQKMALMPKTLVPRSKIHFVQDTPNCGWAGSDVRTDFRATGTFTYDGDEPLIVMDAFIKDTTPIAKMMAQEFAGGRLIVRFELRPHTPTQLMLNLISNPIKAERGKPRRGQLVFSDVYNKTYELDPIDFAWIGT